MAYKIIVQKPAREDAREYAAYLLRESKSQTVVKRWLDRLEEVFRSLAEMPGSHRIIDEQDAFDIPLRQILYHSHRIVYYVNESKQTVHVLRVYHGARRALTPEEISPP